MNSPDYAALRNARDFLSRLLDLPPNEAIDALTNNGEDVLASFNEALGVEAFKVGDSVTAVGVGPATVRDVLAAPEGSVFTVEDDEGNRTHHDASELIPA